MMASKYEITPLSSNKPILKILKGIEEYLHNNPFYKVYFFNGNFVSGTSIYSIDSVSLQDGEELTSHDIVVFKNNYFAVVDAVGETTFTITDAVLFKGDKGDQGIQGETGATGNGIASITKTSTSGNVDTYTILYTNGTSTTFVVTNGANGRGIVSITKTSTSGNVDTYTILYTDNTTSTFEVTNGTSVVIASMIDSESATQGQVLTADGSGGASWQNIGGGGETLTTIWSGSASITSSPTNVGTGLTFNENKSYIFEFENTPGFKLQIRTISSTRYTGSGVYCDFMFPTPTIYVLSIAENQGSVTGSIKCRIQTNGTFDTSGSQTLKKIYEVN